MCNGASDVKYKIKYKYWNSFTKRWDSVLIHEAKAKSFADALEEFYTFETESDADIKALHIISIQKKTWFGWKEI